MLERNAARRRRRMRLVGVVALSTLAVSVAIALGGGFAGSAASATAPSVTKENDANHDGSFSDTETIPSNATYPYVVTYRLTIAAGSFRSHQIVGISDDKTSSLTSSTYSPSCASLVNTPIAANTSEVCYYDVTLNGPSTSPLVNTATITWDNAGGDVARDTSTVNFPPITIAGSSFVVGDLTVGPIGQAVGKAVTFWGAQWWKLNSLSGGSGPAAFKGFQDDPSTPSCGVNWTSRPGNSTPPPATIPAYLAVIVSSSITQSGSSIGGDTLHIVLVKTNAGYQGNPGHAGTGTIVSVLC